MRLLFAPLAQSDLEEIGDYIALDNPMRALAVRKSDLAYSWERRSANASSSTICRIRW